MSSDSRQSAGGDARPSSSEIHHGRFLPGVVLEGRYRIVGLIGRGAMGEVYRADDLRLGQVVALKFLPVELQERPDLLARHLEEVRIARQVSHPNVCRVHDVGEFEGQAFLSMEYVDGEDLESLLRRVGRLPVDRANEVARQLCAGLAAAHDRGVLHRDLKPANVMIDGRGRARITDFGLARHAGAADAGDGGVAGTPGYMAPELYVGRGASVRSDVYALGLVLYELYTGRAPFEADDLGELVRRHREEEPPPPARYVPDLPERVQDALLRCLEKDPAARPGSALEVAGALPGGDPFAAVLASGETPSPELVAAAGGSGALRRGTALTLALAIALGALGVVWSNGRTMVSSIVELPLPREVLADRARGLLDALDAPHEGDHEADGLLSYGNSLWRARRGELGQPWRARMARGRPAKLAYWLRTSPTPLLSWGRGGRAGLSDPPLTTPGMTAVSLFPDGRLLRFQRVPSSTMLPDDEPPAPDWTPLLEAAGIDLGWMWPELPRLNPGFPCDYRVAWSGVDPDEPWVHLWVEGAALAGDVLFFQVAYVWPPPEVVDTPRGPRRLGSLDRADEPGAGAPEGSREEERAATAGAGTTEAGRAGGAVREGGGEASADGGAAVSDAEEDAREAEAAAAAAARSRFYERWRDVAFEAIRIALLFLGAWFARRHLRDGRGDRRGAFRIAGYLVAVLMANWLLSADHQPDMNAEWDLFKDRLSRALFDALFLWLMYVSVEPLARRYWPRFLIAWSRLLAGRWNDPLVARDLLVGLGAGVGMALMEKGTWIVASAAGRTPLPVTMWLDTWLGPLQQVGQLLSLHADGGLTALAMLFTLAVLRVVLRRELPALVGIVVVGTALWPGPVHLNSVPWDLGLHLGLTLVAVGLLLRSGLVALVVAMSAYGVLMRAPLTLDAGAWSWSATLVAGGVLAALLWFGTSRATREARA